ncbi:hypothetical protein BV25DRAFT_1841638 [Artomyces pyxidatus]|uniref:Uncharacterized protein n=1 Tax=Artomyces pyxidatus TaxID=48021 RepID=A0ACB8SNS7_9AGAM|nr:hypothetical protein BV25DRAFT_1841638 [Artomyces pyxidatus]
MATIAEQRLRTGMAYGEMMWAKRPVGVARYSSRNSSIFSRRERVEEGEGRELQSEKRMQDIVEASHRKTPVVGSVVEVKKRSKIGVGGEEERISSRVRHSLELLFFGTTILSDITRLRILILITVIIGPNSHICTAPASFHQILPSMRTLAIFPRATRLPLAVQLSSSSPKPLLRKICEVPSHCPSIRTTSRLRPRLTRILETCSLAPRGMKKSAGWRCTRGDDDVFRIGCLFVLPFRSYAKARLTACGGADGASGDECRRGGSADKRRRQFPMRVALLSQEITNNEGGFGQILQKVRDTIPATRELIAANGEYCDLPRSKDGAWERIAGGLRCAAPGTRACPIMHAERDKIVGIRVDYGEKVRAGGKWVRNLVVQPNKGAKNKVLAKLPMHSKLGTIQLDIDNPSEAQFWESLGCILKGNGKGERGEGSK